MNLWTLWGKTMGPKEADYHPVLCHMVDVANVARSFLQPPSSQRWRDVLGHALGADPDSLADWLPWLIGMHDIGKISAAFQMQDDTQAHRLRSEGVPFGEWRSALDVHHTAVGQAFAMRTQSARAPGARTRLRTAWAHMVAGHHGRYAVPGSLAETHRKIAGFEPPVWGDWRIEACEFLYNEVSPGPRIEYPEPGNVSAAITVLTGFTILCDWLGSDTSFFSRALSDFPAYTSFSARQARLAVDHAGFAIESVSYEPERFALLFPDKAPARPLQEAIDAVPEGIVASPCLAIIEAPTGEGKTEAALALAHRIARYRGTDELYYALPTTATSNQMFGRLERHLSDRLRLGAHVKLVHGQAFLAEDGLRLEIAENGDSQGPAAALEWFGPRKRALLAPFGVGTIDQCELAALDVRHGALRLIGLAGKVVILDEVHAYDVYMTAIVERLLAWLAALGSSVIMLSATLPESKREALVRAYTGGSMAATAISSAYPSVWIAGRSGSFHATPPAVQPQRNIGLDWLHLSEDDHEGKARWLLDRVREGGCACWIANTVARAQRLYAAVHDAKSGDTECLLLHAQFPLERRAALETQLATAYGPPGDRVRRPGKAIVIGTQVLEQSLDLDFDAMATDLAPIDLLLQRAGRLHRHARPRPAERAKPRLSVQLPLDETGQPNLDVDRHIYAEYTLLKTWEILADRTNILLPADYRTLVDAVYGEPGEPHDERLAHALETLKKAEKDALHEAGQRLIALPHPDQPFCTAAGVQFEESETLAGWVIARTRLGEESVTVIPMEREDGQARLSLLEERFDLGRGASRDVQLRLLRYALRISNPAAIPAVRAQAERLPPLFGRSALLRDALPLWLQGGRALLPVGRGQLILELDTERGLIVTHKRRIE